MRAILNHQLFATESFDSGALNVLCSVIHQFSKPGRHVAVVLQNGIEKRSIAFEVSAASPNTQLDIDLADTEHGTAAAGDCGCANAQSSAGGLSAPLPSVSPAGYVLFHVSHGEGGYSVRVGEPGKAEGVFDSTALGKGDLFALSLLAPTRYSMVNRTGKAAGHIAVTMSAHAARSLATLEAVYIDSAKDSFSPHEVRVVSGQGIVFRVLETSRIVIEQAEPPKDGQAARARRRFRAQRSPARKPEAKATR